MITGDELELQSGTSKLFNLLTRAVLPMHTTAAAKQLKPPSLTKNLSCCCRPL